MSVLTVLFLLAISVAVLAAALIGVGAGVLAYLSGDHPAAAVIRGGATFAAALTLEVMLIGLAYTVLHR